MASTEHAYKRPLDAFLYLRDATHNIKTEILPAVEAISQEGIDMIFLYESEKALTAAIRDLKPFCWSIWDTATIAAQTNAISIIPHPFTPGRSGIVAGIGVEGFMQIQAQCDYVEIHNGLSLFLMEIAAKKPDAFKVEKTAGNIQKTFKLPEEFILDGVGQAISSDAHHPGHQRIVGQTSEVIKDGDWFGFLKNRVCFEEAVVSEELMSKTTQLRQLMQSGRCVLGEYSLKTIKKVKTRSRKRSQEAADRITKTQA
ncbi:MAG: hypothetical protein OQK35_05015 [Alphaproteobacteria bacterium]|nr:hypothetical protein [Rhodospirillales bacterium]MCW9045673.1 hypothetical protein [Alphaproteobacteria bacterium]